MQRKTNSAPMRTATVNGDLLAFVVNLDKPNFQQFTDKFEHFAGRT